MEQKKILFVSHDANRAGSQLLLLQLLRLLKDRGVPMHLLLCSGGELEQEFEEVVSITRLYQNDKVSPTPFTGKLLKKVNLYKLYEERTVQRINDRIATELRTSEHWISIHQFHRQFRRLLRIPYISTSFTTGTVCA
jgi:hypothetical protein